MLRSISVIIVIAVGIHLVATGDCSSSSSNGGLAQPEPSRNFHEIQNELDELYGDISFTELEKGYIVDSPSIIAQHPRDKLDIVRLNYKTIEVVLHHLMFTACYYREQVIMNAMESAKNKTENEFLQNLYEGHSRAFQAIQKYFNQMNELLERIHNDMAKFVATNRVGHLRLRLERRMNEIKDRLRQPK